MSQDKAAPPKFRRIKNESGNEPAPAEDMRQPALNLEDNFQFACHRGLECYTSCCRDVNIFLTPNDVRRLKNAIGITSSEFLEKYTDLVTIKNRLLPLIQLKMDTENENKCFFVRSHGCVYYEHRPWACRMFPLDEFAAGGFALATSGERCHGLVKGDQWKVREWLMNQGATQSKEADGNWESLAANPLLTEVDAENPQIQQMIIMALYDLDRFRQFVLKSSFLERFDLEPEQLDAIKSEEIALLDLGYSWVRFGLLGQKTLKLKPEAEAAAKQKEAEVQKMYDDALARHQAEKTKKK
jgi:hypothetical protein